jgi:hypothetical protein
MDLAARAELLEPGFDVEYRCPVDRVKMLDMQVEAVDLDQAAS